MAAPARVRVDRYAFCFTPLGNIMKKLALFAVLLGFSISAIGCGSPAPPAKKVEEPKKEAAK